MQSRYVNGLTIRSLRDGDTDTVSSLFARMGQSSRERRFCGAKPRLSDLELAHLARVDRDHHVLVGFVDGDSEPVGIARLVRDGSSAEIAFAVADDLQSRGVGSTLASVLADDARAAGITQLVATVRRQPAGGRAPETARRLSERVVAGPRARVSRRARPVAHPADRLGA